MSRSSQKQNSWDLLPYRKGRRGFSDFFVIFKTKMDQHMIEEEKITVVLFTPSSNSTICFQSYFVPFLWPKGWISAFSSIRQSIVTTRRVVYRNELHSGYFYSKDYVTALEQYHRSRNVPAETKTFQKRFSVVQKMTAQLGSSNWPITFSGSQKILSDSNNYP